jgi:hypothetical protein
MIVLDIKKTIEIFYIDYNLILFFEVLKELVVIVLMLMKVKTQDISILLEDFSK